MKTYDFIGIGIGPFNLSIAALAEGLDGFSSLFLERKPHFSWHPGMMVPDCHMQTSFLKDLVSAVEPTNRHSFLNYLVQRKKVLPLPDHRTAHGVSRRVCRLPVLGGRKPHQPRLQPAGAAGEL